MVRETRGLWSHPGFLTLWIGQATSMLGSRVGGFAFDLTAILTLQASPGQIAILNGCVLVPAMVAGPWAGLWADRVRRRPLLIAADLARAAALLTIPLAALTHTLSIAQLDIVAAISGAFTVLFDVSYRAALPLWVGPERITEANSTLQGTAAVTEAGGWSIAGVLVQLFTAPLAVTIDALSYVVSAVSLLGLPNEASLSRGDEHGWWWDNLRAGATMIRRDPDLRVLAVTQVTWDFVGGIIGVVILLFFIRDLRLEPAILGPLTAIGGLSALAGAVIAGRVARRLGLIRTLIGSLYFNNVGLLPVVIAGGPPALVAACVALGQSTDAGRTIYEIHRQSLLQRLVPTHLAGRANATFTTIDTVATALGLLAGGILGQDVGLRPTLVLALCGNLLIPLWLVRHASSTWQRERDTWPSDLHESEQKSRRWSNRRRC